MSEVRPHIDEASLPPETSAGGEPDAPRIETLPDQPESAGRAESDPSGRDVVRSPDLGARSNDVAVSKAGDHFEGFKEELAGEETVDRRLAEIEMIGEEVAAGWEPASHEPLSAEVRYLHVSRTIHQLVTDRNRSVGIFLAVASILVAAATGMLNIKAEVVPIVPLRSIQYWCLPATFSTLSVLAIFISLLLIRARIGLIYEVAKLNTLLGLPSKRVERVNPLSIFYLMHLMVVVLGGASAGLTVAMIGYDWLSDGVIGSNRDESARTGFPGLESLPTSLPQPFEVGGAAVVGIGMTIAFLFILGLETLYYVTILRNTTEAKLEEARSPHMDRTKSNART